MLIINNVRFCFRVNKKHYPQTLLEECKNVIRKNKTENLIKDDLDESDDESDNQSGNESDSESHN